MRSTARRASACADVDTAHRSSLGVPCPRAVVPRYARGTVTDPQGAVVSGASVLIIDEDSGATRTIDTDTEGRYEAAKLRPGTYRVEVVAPNFKKFEKTGIVLRAAGTALVDIALEAGRARRNGDGDG